MEKTIDEEAHPASTFLLEVQQHENRQDAKNSPLSHKEAQTQTDEPPKAFEHTPYGNFETGLSESMQHNYIFCFRREITLSRRNSKLCWFSYRIIFICAAIASSVLFYLVHEARQDIASIGLFAIQIGLLLYLIFDSIRNYYRKKRILNDEVFRLCASLQAAEFFIAVVCYVQYIVLKADA